MRVGSTVNRLLVVALLTALLLLAANVRLITSAPPDLWQHLPPRPQRLLNPVEPPPYIGSHKYLNVDFDARAVTWDPCQSIPVVLNLGSAPASVVVMMRDALADITAASGLQFAIEGLSDEPPSLDRGDWQDRYGDRWAPVLVAWTDSAAVPALDTDVLGLTAPSAYVYDERLVYTTGIVVFNGPALEKLLAQPGGGAKVRQTLIHEFGHLVGLDHVEDASQVMYRSATGVTTLGAGDLYGLAVLGAGRCLRA